MSTTRLIAVKDQPSIAENPRFFSNTQIFEASLVASLAIGLLMGAANSRIGRAYNSGAVKQYKLDKDWNFKNQD